MHSYLNAPQDLTIDQYRIGGIGQIILDHRIRILGESCLVLKKIAFVKRQ